VWGDDRLTCNSSSCGQSFPTPGGIPILINEAVSTFKIQYYRHPASHSRRTRIRNFVRAITPRISANVAAPRNYRDFARLLLARSKSPRVLVIGGAEPGIGMQELYAEPRIKLVETDVEVGSRTQIVCDAATLPFRSGSFDGIIMQAVLEYVLDPYHCAAEAWRVLNQDGLVYSEMPFMQQVHGGRYDFTRLTHSGHRRLFRHFSEISSGACSGPGMVLAWSVQQMFLSFVGSSMLRDVVRFGASCSLFWLKYFDRILVRQKAGIDGAGGTFFMGRKSVEALSDTELIRLYRGAVTVNGVI
jgi:SAM-dependent methyltransferase